MRRLCAAALIAASLSYGQQTTEGDPMLRAMKDELARSRSLKLSDLESPYYFEYSLDDTDVFSATATLGGLVSSRRSQYRLPRVQARVGTPDFDNTNYIYTDLFGGARFEGGTFPIENNYQVLRREFWLATDRAFKGAVEAITRKRASLRNLTSSDVIPDFSPAKSVQMVLPIQTLKIEEAQWNNRVRALSKVFSAYPQVLASGVSFEANQATYYFANSEGTALRLPDNLAYLRISANGLAPDGTHVRQSLVVAAPEVGKLPAEADLRKQVVQVAEQITQLSKAPMGEEYSGPVLFDGVAGPQVMAELLSNNVLLPRKPVSEPGRPIPLPSSEFEGRVGVRVMPEFLDVVDDPSSANWKGHPLLGAYPIDYEGVAPQKVTLVEKGKLKSFLLTRQPVKTYRASNGHARLPGNFGAHAAVISNLFISNSEPTPAAEMKQKLLQLCKDRGKPYGVIVRRMDYPSSATQEELRQIAASSPNGGRSVSLPLLTYKVFPDGHEELVRGLRFRSVNARSLKDIIAASDTQYQFDYLYSPASFGMQSSSFVAPVSVVGPALLFDDMELDRLQLEQPKLPIVPPPVDAGS